MNDAFQKNMAIVMGECPKKEVELTKAEKENLAAAYFKLYFGLALANWLRGGTVGAAWHRAMAQVDAMLGAKNANNPAVMYLRQVHAAHKTRWSKVMMTNQNRDKEIECGAKMLVKMTQLANREVGSAMAVLNNVIGKYRATEMPADKNVNYAMAQQKMRQMMIMQLNQKVNYGRAA